MTERAWIDESTILRVEVGSTLHGMGTGNDDRDEMGVCLEPFDQACGLVSTFEQHIYRSAAAREHRHDAPSQAGDLDLTIYSLRKWLRLALDGNPSVILLLFAPQSHIVGMDARGSRLREMAPLFASKRAGGRFLGYLQQQKQRLVGERGQKNVNRQALVEAHGFDTKYAGHIIRLGYQGVEFMETGALTLPLKESERQRCIDIRQGRVDLNDVLTEAGELERRLKDLRDTSPLPDQPDTATVEAWMLQTYFEHWKGSYGHERHMEQARAVREGAATE